MANEDETVWIVFNGEIFNFPELRRELEAAGHVFRTRSDTECIVHLYEEHGPEGCASRLVGQFAFAIWDDRKRRLFLARDHLGIKPLFIHATSERILFASEIKAILEDDSIERSIDSAALVDYLTYFYVPAPATIFRGIEKLPAAHYLTWEAGRITRSRYWEAPFRFPRETGSGPRSEDEAAERLEAILRESVRSQLMSDVPLGAFLSGGIDSSIVVGLMAELTNRPVQTFTIGFREAAYNEIEPARRVAEQHRTEHRELIVDPDSLEVLPRLARQLDEPFADASAIPTYYLCRMAREHVTVALSGDGGDEGFAGYRRYRWALKYARFDGLPAGLRRLAGAAFARLGLRGRLAEAARRMALDPASRYADLFGYMSDGSARSLLSPDLARVAASRPAGALIRELHDRAASTDYLTRLQYIDVESYLPDDILVKTDRMSMLNSLEVRVPLLDHRVIEYSATLEPSWRLGKRILKKAAGRLLPPDLLDRPKTGFGVPLKHWFRGDWDGYVRDLLLGKRSRERGLYDARSIESLIEKRSATASRVTNSLYALVMLEEWCRQYLDQPQSAR
jgi:asparagine synthase (glutamine-hydrolysing)